jgi:threonylcarbamoyladenosine tRNA methylthiotransferase MtaB
MKISFYNLGCKVNFAETAQLQDDFRKLGFEIVDFESESDIVFINTCTVTHKADADSRKIIRRAIRQNPKAFIAVGGCYSQLASEHLKEIDGIDAVLGANEKFRINELISVFSKREAPEIFISEKDDAEFYPACSADSNLRMRAVLKIQDGCDYFCTYCAVPHARGRSRSIPFDHIIPFLHDIENQGYKEVVLTGINLGDYRYEGKEFADVLDLIDREELGLRIRISSLEPDLINDEIIDIVADSKSICPHFHIPLQSGSDSILKSMRRRYDTKYFMDLIDKINKRIPDCGIGIDVIVGFPGETEEHFNETYNPE